MQPEGWRIFEGSEAALSAQRRLIRPVGAAEAGSLRSSLFGESQMHFDLLGVGREVSVACFPTVASSRSPYE